MFQVTRVLTANVKTGETFSVPGMLVTWTELRDMVRYAPQSGTVQIYCDTCGESVADCPDVRNSLSCPASWSWQNDDVDGLVLFN
jgi:hypothetical protein